MARTIGKLTALAVDKAKRRGYYGDGGGLFLQVSASGSKSWVFRFKEAGKLREMGLGATHTSASPSLARTPPWNRLSSSPIKLSTARNRAEGGAAFIVTLPLPRSVPEAVESRQDSI